MSNAVGNNGGRIYSFGAQPVLIDCNFVVDAANGNGLGVRSIKGQGVRNVFMHTSASPGSHRGYLNPNPAPGYALVQLDNNYNRYLGGFSGFASPTSGGTIAITAAAAALTVGNPYVIVSVGNGPEGQATITTVADVNGSLAGKYFTLYDSYGNSYVIWFNVSGVGVEPLVGPAAIYGQRGLHYVKQAISINDTAATIAADLVLTIENLPSPIVGSLAFTASAAGAVVTVVSTLNQPLGGIPQDGSTVVPAQGPSVPIYFNLSPAGSASAGSIWTDGSGHLYTVSTTISAGALLSVVGIGAPIGSVLTYVSGPGATSALSFTSAVSAYATGFAFALTVSDTNLQDWQAVGLQKGLTPAVGQSFIATSTGAGSSTGLVMSPGVSGINSIEVIGDPNASIAPQPQGGSAHVGSWFLVQFLAPTSSGVTTPIATAPASGSTVGMSFYVDYKNSPSNLSTNGSG